MGLGDLVGFTEYTTVKLLDPSLYLLVKVITYLPLPTQRLDIEASASVHRSTVSEKPLDTTKLREVAPTTSSSSIDGFEHLFPFSSSPEMLSELFILVLDSKVYEGLGINDRRDYDTRP